MVVGRTRSLIRGVVLVGASSFSSRADVLVILEGLGSSTEVRETRLRVDVRVGVVGEGGGDRFRERAVGFGSWAEDLRGCCLLVFDGDDLAADMDVSLAAPPLAPSAAFLDWGPSRCPWYDLLVIRLSPL